MASPRNILISVYDWGQDPASSISGGSFEPQLPAENMLKIQPQMVAQALGSSVIFTLNLGGPRSIGLIHLQRLITDPGATITVTAGSYAATVRQLCAKSPSAEHLRGEFHVCNHFFKLRSPIGRQDDIVKTENGTHTPREARQIRRSNAPARV